MTRLPLDYWRDGTVYWARYVRRGDSPVRVHWTGLNDAETVDAIDAAHWQSYAINNNNCEEVAVYLRIAWQLLSDREKLGAAIFYAGDAASQLSQPGSAVRWQCETDSEGPPDTLRQPQAVPARSSVQLRPPPTSDQRWIRDTSLLFRIRSFPELATLLRVTLCDASGEINLYGTTEAGAARIIEEMRAEQTPMLSQLLRDDDVFVDIGVGVDLGYNDYILVASHRPLELLLSSIVEAAERAIERYEQQISEYTAPETALSLIAELAGEA